MDTLLIFFLNRSFFDIGEKNKKPVFLNSRVPPISVYNLKWRAKFQIYRLHVRDSDWLNFIHFSGYKYKIRLISILWKREDHALISISTILKLSALLKLKDKNNRERYIFLLGFWIWIEEPKFPFFKFGNYPFITTYRGRKNNVDNKTFFNPRDIKIEHGNFSKRRQLIIN